MNFKFIYEDLSEKIIFSILTVIQFTIVILSIYVGIGILRDINSSISSVKMYFNDGEYYKLNESLSVGTTISTDEENMEKNIVTLKSIKNYFDNKDIEFLSVYRDEVLVNYKEASKEAMVTYMMVDFQDDKYARVQGFCVNYNFLNKMNYKYIQQPTEKFQINKEYIPIILGYNYRDKYKVGDEIKTLTTDDTGEHVESKMKVIGILAKENYIHEDGISAVAQSLDNAILYPFDESFFAKSQDNSKLKLITNIELKKYLSGGYIILNNKESVEEINKDLIDLGSKYQLENLNKSIENYKKEYIDQLKPGIYMAAIVIIFSIISISVVMINSIIKNRREFGINIMMGATMGDIRARVLGQVFVLVGISLILFCGILKVIEVLQFNLVNLILTLVLTMGILFIISIILVLSLNKYSINDLIRRNE